MNYNLIIHNNNLNRTRLYGGYDSYKEAKHAAQRISGKVVVYNAIGEKMRVDSYIILDDVQYINAKF